VDGRITRTAGAATARAKSSCNCSFCGKSQHEVRKLISGTVGVRVRRVRGVVQRHHPREVQEEKNAASARKKFPTPREIHQFLLNRHRPDRRQEGAVGGGLQSLQGIENEGKVATSSCPRAIFSSLVDRIGQTLLAETLARLLNVPSPIADANADEAGYVGEDVENQSTLQQLLDDVLDVLAT